MLSRIVNHMLASQCLKVSVVLLNQLLRPHLLDLNHTFQLQSFNQTHVQTVNCLILVIVSLYV